MASVNYVKDPRGQLEKVLERLGWVRVTDRLYLDTCRWLREESGLWENDRSRLFVDEIGVFLYRLEEPTDESRWVRTWVRTAGLSHDRIFPNKHELVFDGGRLDLGNGAWLLT